MMSIGLVGGYLLRSVVLGYGCELRSGPQDKEMRVWCEGEGACVCRHWS